MKDKTSRKPLKLSEADEKAFHGLRLYPLSPQGSGPFSALKITIEPHSHFPAIIHAKTYEFFYVLKGSGYGRVGRKQVRFAKGDHVFMKPGTAHDFHTGKTRMEALVIFSPYFDPTKPDVVEIP